MLYSLIDNIIYNIICDNITLLTHSESLSIKLMT